MPSEGNFKDIPEVTAHCVQKDVEDKRTSQQQIDIYLETVLLWLLGIDPTAITTKRLDNTVILQS